MKEYLYEKIYKDLYLKIRFGLIRQGEALPTESQVMGQYGVSRITAIRALNELKAKGFISRSRKTGSRVLACTDTVKEGFKKTVAVILSFSDRNYAQILSGMKKAAAASGICLTFFYTGKSAEKEREILTDLEKYPLDGIIAEPCTRFANIGLLSGFIIKKTPLVFIDTRVEGLNAPCISSDNRAGMYYIVKSLLKKGHEKIAYYPMHITFISSETSRFNGYCEALISKNIPVKEEYLLWADSASHDFTMKGITEFDLKNARQAVDKLLSLKEKPTAVCCVNDFCAECMIKALAERGLLVPGDISVTGFDDTPFALEKGITSARQDYESIGSFALEKLLALFKYLSDNKDIFIPVKITERDSVKTLNGNK